MITVKRGDTLSIIVRRKNLDGTPRTGEAGNLRSQIRTSKDDLIASFTISEVEDTPGDYLFVVPANVTELIPINKYYMDIEYRDGDFVQSSETFSLEVVKDVTK